MLDLPTPPLPEAIAITVVALPSAKGDGRAGPPATLWRRARRSSSVMVSRVTRTASTPGSGASASLTRRWISAFSGQPATVSLMPTSTCPRLIRMSPTMPRSTIERRSSGSWTGRSAAITASRSMAPRPPIT